MTKKTAASSKQTPLWHYLLCHGEAFTASIKQLTRRPGLTLMVMLVLGIAMALPTGLYLSLQNAKQLTRHWNNKPHIALYLQNDLLVEKQQQLLERLKKHPNIANATLITPEEGLRSFTHYSGFKDITAFITDNPLPAVIEVEPASHLPTLQEMEQLLDGLQGLPEVHMAQLNKLWVERLYEIMQLLQRCMYALGFIFGVGVVLIIGSTIHLAMERGREEVHVLKLLGATTAFIRRPFLYQGFLYGLLGGSVAIALIGGLLFWLHPPVEHLARLYNSDFHLWMLSARHGLSLVFLGGFLGLTGAYFASKS